MEENTLARLLLIGGSAGSLEVLIRMLQTLKPLKQFALVIVLHRKNNDDNLLEELISSRAAMPVADIEDKTPVTPGKIYIAPADYHLLFEKSGELGLDVSDKVNYSRPSIDVVFQSAADAYGDRVVAVLLSGANADGTEGLKAIKDCGGKIVIQNPNTAEMPFMPQFALDSLEADLVINADDLATFINNLNSGLDF